LRLGGEEAALRGGPVWSGEAAESSTGRHDAVARYDDRESVAAEGSADGPGGAGSTDPVGEPSMGDGRAREHVAGRRVHPALERLGRRQSPMTRVLWLATSNR
jgi:hypothetical protein